MTNEKFLSVSAHTAEVARKIVDLSAVQWISSPLLYGGHLHAEFDSSVIGFTLYYVHPNGRYYETSVSITADELIDPDTGRLIEYSSHYYIMLVNKELHRRRRVQAAAE